MPPATVAEPLPRRNAENTAPSVLHTHLAKHAPSHPPTSSYPDRPAADMTRSTQATSVLDSNQLKQLILVRRRHPR